jgi:hypothetical protein
MLNYITICFGCVALKHRSEFPNSEELHWELREPSRNLQNPTQMLSDNRLDFISFYFKVGYQKGLGVDG